MNMRARRREKLSEWKVWLKEEPCERKGWMNGRIMPAGGSSRLEVGLDELNGKSDEREEVKIGWTVG